MEGKQPALEMLPLDEDEHPEKTAQKRLIFTSNWPSLLQDPMQ